MFKEIGVFPPVLSICEYSFGTFVRRYRIFIYTYVVKKKQHKTNVKFSSFSTNIYIENLYVCTSSGIIFSRFSSKIPHAIILRLTYLQVQKCIISVSSTILQRTLQTPLSRLLGHLVVILRIQELTVS